MKNIYDYTLKDLEEFFISIGETKFKAAQVFDWLYKKRVTKFEEMTNLKKSLIEILNKEFCINDLKILKKEEDTDVIKYLFALDDGNKIEAVLMNHNYGISLCISSQVGCNMGCVFCESGRLKKVRNLMPSEMVLQILTIEKEIQQRISHVVLMGIGEPFDNYDNVITFIDIIKENKGISIGARHITVSTCGITPKIELFLQDENQVNLAISLHASNDELRNKLMPINKVYNIEKLIEIIKKYINKTNRRVTFEYVLIKGINDRKENALELSKLLRGINCYVNLIPYNETSYINYQKSDKETILAFYDILKKNKINVTIRKEFGNKVKAACGQLKSQYEEDK